MHRHALLGHLLHFPLPLRQQHQVDPYNLVIMAIGVSLAKASHTIRFVANALSQSNYGSDRQTAYALYDCLSSFGEAR
ncbi:hypothetical protein LINPERHAP2_LOCUS23291 [Linum perenne]